MATTLDSSPAVNPSHAAARPGGIRLGPTQSVSYVAAALILLGAGGLAMIANGVFFGPSGWSPALTWWIRWMIAIGLSSAIFAFTHTGARWVLAAFVFNHAVAIGTSMSGLVPMSDGLINVTHVVFWTPAVVVLVRGLGTLNRRSVYGVWHVLALATMAISLVFDYRDAFRYLFL